MKIIKHTLIAIVAFTILVFLLLQNHTIQDKLFGNAVKQLLATNKIFMDDALSVAVCGSRAPLPSPNRAETCLLVQAGSSKFIFDSGEGSAANLQNWGIDYSDLEAVVLSHLHSDHISDVPEIQFQSWLMGRKEPLSVLGPVGTISTLDGFRLA